VKDKREFQPALSRRGWIFAALGAALALGVSLWFDTAVQDWIAQHQSPGLRSFMEGVSRAGDWPEHVGLGLVLIAIAWSRGSKNWMRVFAAMILACALAGIVARALKIGTGRARPNVQTEERWTGPQFSSKYNAFPSGHTAASSAFFATLVFAGWRIGSGLLLIPALIAFSRMYVAAHYLSDVVAAALLGLLVAWFVAERVVGEVRSQIRN
jgi:membrane-associated phospholipid phosphatase